MLSQTITGGFADSARITDNEPSARSLSTRSDNRSLITVSAMVHPHPKESAVDNFEAQGGDRGNGAMEMQTYSNPAGEMQTYTGSNPAGELQTYTGSNPVAMNTTGANHLLDPQSAANRNHRASRGSSVHSSATEGERSLTPLHI